MKKRIRIRKNELLKDYAMLDRMSKDLLKGRNSIKKINRKIVTKMSSNLKIGILENLETVSGHMDRAQKELEKAKKLLKLL